MTSNDEALPPTSAQHLDEELVAQEHGAIRTRQLWLTTIVIALAIWVASEFLVPVAWAAVIGIAEWPLYRRALARFPNRPMMLAVMFTAATALFVIGPL